MTLTAGATLQSSKYVIQARLHQSDFGATYEATHTLLDQPVILQTLNPVVQQRPDFAELRQQFMQAVRSLSRQEASQGTARVLDCFEEAGMPFIVLQQPIAGQVLPNLNDWLTLPPEPSPEKSVEIPKSIAPAVSTPVRQPISPEPQQPQPLAELAAGVAAARAKGAIVSESLPVASAPEISVPVAPQVQASPVQTSQVQAPQVQVPQATVSVAPSAPKAPKAPKSTPSKGLPLLPDLPTHANPPASSKSSELAPKRKLPVALLITILAGLGLGAGGGFALRYQPSSQAGQPSQTGQTNPNSSQSASGFSSNLFSHPQTFPSQTDWPIQADPTLFPSAPKLEEPVYRSAPVPDYYTAPSAQPYRNPAPQLAAPSSTDSSNSDSKSTPELSPDAATPASPLPKPADSSSSAPKREAIDSAPPAPTTSARQPVRQAAPAPVPAPELSPLVPIAPDLSAPPPISTPPAQAPKGLGTRPLVSQ